jgi:copper(I)-binding protein
VNPFKRRSSAVAAMATCGLAVSLVLGGCSAGQVSQSATQEPAVNGTSGKAGPIALRNVHIRAAQTTDYVRPGEDAELILVVANNSADVPDKLVSITSDVGTVSLSGDGDVPVNGVLVIGSPDGGVTPLEAVESADAAEAPIELSKPITNGLTYDFTFTFEKAGATTVAVPISAGETPRREEAVEAGSSEESGGHSGGH